MSSYYEIDAQSEFRAPKVKDKDTHNHNMITDIARLIYSEADERLCIGTWNDWKIVATPNDILDQNTKVLFGSYPLPTGWNLDASNDDKVALVTTNASDIGDTTGDWQITGMIENGSHKHSMSRASAVIMHRSSGSVILSSYYHEHTTSTDGDHFHTITSSWRPYHRKYCIAEYGPPLPAWYSYFTWNTHWEPGHVDCWDPTTGVIGTYSGCTGNYIEVKGTWANDIRPTKFRVIHDGPDSAPNGLRNIRLYESDWTLLGSYLTATGYDSGTEIAITWGTDDMFRLGIESYENGAGWNPITVTDVQFYL